jgi:hypothetical protein
VKLPSSLIALFLGLVASVSAVGCAADDTGGTPSELVSAPEWNVAMALVRDGDSLYVARATRLDRIDARSGAVSEVAGPEWAECPRDPNITWLTTVDDYSYPNLLVRGSTVYLLQPSCGLWSFDIATKKKHMLVDPSIEARTKRFDAEGVYPTGATWNGKDGPDWRYVWGMALATDGDGLVGCFHTSSDEPDPNAVGGIRRVYPLELRSFATDGTPRERLTFLDQDRTPRDGENYCKHVIADATSILFSTDKSILRWDRQTRKLDTVVSGFRYGTEGLAQDATHVFYVSPRNEVRKLSRATGEDVVLRETSSSPRERPRLMLTVDGDHLYFHEGYSLMRIEKDGTGVIELAAGTEDDWVLPMALGIGDEHVYFERMTEKVETGERKRLGSLRRVAR